MDRCVLLDVDGVIADLVGELCARLPGGFKPEHFKSYDFADVLPPKALVMAWGFMREPGFVRDMPEYPGALAFLSKLPSGATVVTKPFTKAPYWMWERAEWLRVRGVERVIHTAEKHLVRGDALVEDDPGNLGRWLRSNPCGKGILMDRPWNQAAFHAPDQLVSEFIYGRVKRAASFDHVLEILEGFSSGN